MSVQMWGSCEQEQHSNSSQQQEEHTADSCDEEVSSPCCAVADEGESQQYTQQMPLHRVKRVWSHLCMLEQLDDDCFRH